MAKFVQSKMTVIKPPVWSYIGSLESLEKYLDEYHNTPKDDGRGQRMSIQPIDDAACLTEKWRDKIVMQKIAEGVYRGSFEEFYPVLREHGAEPEALETFWDELGDIPVDDDGIIQESFLWWPKGTDREDIWRWFDEKYPGGVKKLMKLEENE